jgi:hypothetical protein
LPRRKNHVALIRSWLGGAFHCEDVYRFTMEVLRFESGELAPEGYSVFLNSVSQWRVIGMSLPT